MTINPHKETSNNEVKLGTNQISECFYLQTGYFASLAKKVGNKGKRISSNYTDHLQ